MPTFDELMLDPEVANHPLLDGWRQASNVRDFFEKRAQDNNINDEGEQRSLKDLMSFSVGGIGEENTKDDQKMRDVVHTASMELHNLLGQFYMPIFPKMSFNKIKDVKYANVNSDIVKEGKVVFNLELVALSGVKKLATVEVNVVGGRVVPPSVMEVDKQIHVISQSTINNLLGRVTSYETKQLRNQFDPPFTRQEKEMAVAQRNQIGLVPRDNYFDYMNRPKPRSAAEEYDPFAYNVNGEFNPELKEHVESNYTPGMFVQLLNNFEGYSPEDLSSLATFMYTKDEYGNYPDEWIFASGEHVVSSEQTADWEAAQKLDNLLRPYLSDTKTAKVAEEKAENPACHMPTAYENVVKAMEEAEDEGRDTFPRAYNHLLRNYILNEVSTADKDKWMIHLINDGFCINPYGHGNNRGRNRPRKASNRTADFDKEMPMEVSDEPVDMEEVIENMPSDLSNGLFYRETKMPIECSDGVKFNGHDGPMRGNVVDLDMERGFIIIKSKGMEYRIHLDDEAFEPLPKTFQKMYK